MACRSPLMGGLPDLFPNGLPDCVPVGFDTEHVGCLSQSDPV